MKFSRLLIPGELSRHSGKIVPLRMVGCLGTIRTGELIHPRPKNRDMGHPHLWFGKENPDLGQPATILIILFLLILPLPFYVLGVLHRAAMDVDQDVVAFTGISRVLIVILNTTTSIYCLIPLLMLLVVLGHKLFWPALSRFIYSLCRNKIVSNRKVLKSVGTLAFTYALTPGDVGFADILKLFH